ncbi:type VI secretion system membrane subunit TssM [Serratia sp. N21D137]|uniref:type VI secretion system membrane subunit TssM n=1 Tax=Serratia sp. N21D137 TaxID=3397495 RepID=UPI0039E1F33B
MLTFLLSIMTNRLLWGALCTTVVAYAIWAIGPMLLIADTSPLKSEQNRIISIMAVYLIWIQSHILPRLYNSWLNRKLMNNLKEELQNNDPQQRLNCEYQILAERFHGAAQMLKKAHFTKTGWSTRFSNQYIYQLPWYVILGASGSGKTTVLANSGLDFPLVDRFGKTVLRGIGGTRNCDWWFSNEAVMLDTAGRYTTQDSEQAQDAGEWFKFIGLLRKYRRRQPINGAVVTVSISDLLTQSTDELHQQAVNLRQRLSELHEQLGIRFPVYLFVTKADLLKGFRAWFADYDKVKRDQIWGVTFPWGQAKLANFDLMSSFKQEFVLLQQRLEAGLPEAMMQEYDAKTRAEAWLFPQEFAAIYPLLADYLSIVFARSNFETEFSPRGIYFTSSAQEGRPFDSVLRELNRALSLPQGNDSDNRDAVSKEAPTPDSKERSYFIKNLLQNVIFQEAGIAGQNRWWELLNRAAIWSGYLMLVLLLVLLCILWLTSYGKNKAYLEEVLAKVSLVELQSKALQKNGQHNLFEILPLLNGLLEISKSANFDVNDPPNIRRMGLYRGYDISDASQILYQKTLRQMLLPDVAMRIATWLRNDDGSDAEYSYAALKAYQMLYQPKRYDGKFLVSWVMLNLQRNLPQNMTQEQLRQLEGHLFQLLEQQIQLSPYPKDKALIARESALINQKPFSSRVYDRLKRLLEHDDNLKPVSLAMLGGPQSELVFSRKSGTPIANGVLGLYTPDGYWQIFNKQIDSVTSELYDDDTWVLGSTSVQEDKQQTNNTVRQLYIGDFITNWDRFLADIQLHNSPSLSSRINVVRLLSANNSPLRLLVMNLSQVLDLARSEPQIFKDESHLEQDNRAKRTLEALFHDDGGSIQSAVISKTPEQLVTEHYAQLIDLAQPLEKGSKTIVFDDFLKQLDEVYLYLTAVQDATNSGIQPPGSNSISRLHASAGRLPGVLQTMFSKMAIGASSDTQHRDLDNVRKRIHVEVGGFCHQAIAGRYPLVSSASSEITPDDLARMFAPGTGKMDTFFRDNLTNKVDTTQANWRFMPGIDGKTLPGSEGALRSFQQAQSIRDVFFASGTNTPSFKMMVRTISMDNSILNLTLDADGQQLRYSHGPQAVQMINWPGPGGTNQVRMQLGLADGTTSTLVTSGFWALNRFFDKAHTVPGSDLSYQATFNVDGYRITLEFVPNSIHNPFQLPRFSCP